MPANSPTTITWQAIRAEDCRRTSALTGVCGRLSRIYTAAIESGVVRQEPVYRKTSRQLQGYFDHFTQRANTALTMMPIRQDKGRSRTVLQQLGSGKVFDDLVGEIVPTPAPQKGSGSGVGGVEEGGSAGSGGGILPNSVSDEEIIYIGGDDGGGGQRC